MDTPMDTAATTIQPIRPVRHACHKLAAVATTQSVSGTSVVTSGAWASTFGQNAYNTSAIPAASGPAIARVHRQRSAPRSTAIAAIGRRPRKRIFRQSTSLP